MDIQVKERLTGALILVALLVLLVPEILPGPVAERASEKAATDAADGPPLRSYALELGAEGSASGSDQKALAPQSAAAPAPAAEPEVTESHEVASVTPREELAPEPASTADPVPAKPESKPAAAAREPSAPAGGWWVQIGSFSQAANAQRLTQQLIAAGFPAQLSSVRSNGKELFRVRAGPVGDRDAAETLRTRLAAAGHKGSLVAP